MLNWMRAPPLFWVGKSPVTNQSFTWSIEGNHITVSQNHPFLQIGETKYGKPILDRIIRPDTPLETAFRTALSLDSTMRSNVTVGPPIEVLFYRKDSLLPHEWYAALDEAHPYLAELRQSWDDNIKRAVEQLPNLDLSFLVP